HTNPCIAGGVLDAHSVADFPGGSKLAVYQRKLTRGIDMVTIADRRHVCCQWFSNFRQRVSGLLKTLFNSAHMSPSLVFWSLQLSSRCVTVWARHDRHTLHGIFTH